jgi:hypothetical protein
VPVRGRWVWEDSDFRPEGAFDRIEKHLGHTVGVTVLAKLVYYKKHDGDPNTCLDVEVDRPAILRWICKNCIPADFALDECCVWLMTLPEHPRLTKNTALDKFIAAHGDKFIAAHGDKFIAAHGDKFIAAHGDDRTSLARNLVDNRKCFKEGRILENFSGRGSLFDEYLAAANAGSTARGRRQSVRTGSRLIKSGFTQRRLMAHSANRPYCRLGETAPAAVVIDTLNRSIAGSESDDRDMALYIQAADAIRDIFNCAVIIVPHCSIDATRRAGIYPLPALPMHNSPSSAMRQTISWLALST